MRIHTNAGEVELTADMVRPGMVFQSEHWRCADAPDGAMIMARPSGVWCGDERGWTSTTGCGVIASTGRLLGCDPAIAAREDVERYGVAPGIDAGAHGFARLRTGGAVDLRRQENFCSQFVYEAPSGERRTRRWADLGEDERFIGLDARHASAEDVERLCCGAQGPGQARPRCTLAIGDHAEHEDIATGTRWSPKVEPPDASRWTPIEGVTPIAFNPRGEAYVPSAATLAGRAWGQADKFDMRKAVETAAGNGFRADGRPRGDETFCGSFDTRAQIVFNTNADAWEALAALREDGTFSCACGSSKPAEHAEGCALPWQYRMAATWAVDYTNARGQGLQRVVAEGLFGACAVALLAWCCRLWDERPCGNCEATRVVAGFDEKWPVLQRSWR